MSEPGPRPDWDHYLMSMAMAVRARANCLGNRVGALIALEHRTVSTGYNGTPTDMPNCDEGGCERCAQRERFAAGEAYDVCICVHAEQNALLATARFGIPVDGGTMYSTLRPCFGCTKEMLQAGIVAVRYLHDWQYPDEQLRREYERLQARFPGGVKQVVIDDPDADWALSRGR